MQSFKGREDLLGSGSSAKIVSQQPDTQASCVAKDAAFPTGPSELRDEQLQQDNELTGASHEAEEKPLGDEDTVVLQELDRIAASYKHRCSRVKEARHEGSTKRSDVHYHWRSFKEDLESLQESGNSLLGSSVTKVEGSTKRSKSETKLLRKEFQSAFHVLSGTLRKVDKLMEELRDCDYKLKKAEEAQNNASASLLAAMRKNSLHLDDTTYSDEDCQVVSLAATSQFESVTSSRIRPPIPPQLEAYYDAVNTCRYLGERLNEQDAEHHEQIVRRRLLADQDQPLKLTDQEFEANCEATVRITRKELWSAEFVLMQAERACSKANIELPRNEDFHVWGADEDCGAFPARIVTQDERRLQSDAAQRVSSLKLESLHIPSDIGLDSLQMTSQWVDGVISSVGYGHSDSRSRPGTSISAGTRDTHKPNAVAFS